MNKSSFFLHMRQRLELDVGCAGKCAKAIQTLTWWGLVDSICSVVTGSITHHVAFKACWLNLVVQLWWVELIRVACILNIKWEGLAYNSLVTLGD
jgi:hypothetical protein